MRRFVHYVLSFALGALLGASFLQLIPQAIEEGGTMIALPSVLIGLLLFFVIEKFLSWYHYHVGTSAVRPYAYLSLGGDFLHNFIDGIVLALAFLADTRIGIATTIAVILHEIPQEVSDFSILLHAGFSRGRALFYNVLVSLSTIAGALLAYWFNTFSAALLAPALGIVAGNFIYLAATDFISELHEKSGVGHGVGQFVLILAGIAFVAAPELLL
jgi:zinc and cadmium transporter